MIKTWIQHWVLDLSLKLLFDGLYAQLSPYFPILTVGSKFYKRDLMDTYRSAVVTDIYTDSKGTWYRWTNGEHTSSIRTDRLHLWIASGDIKI